MSTRLPLITDAQAGPPEVVAAIRQRRGGQLLELDRLLLHSPAVAAGWGELMGRVRTQLDLPPLLRELAMCAVAALTGAEYEFFHHAPLYLQAGATEAQLAALRRLGLCASGSIHSDVISDPVFDAESQAALAVVIEMTQQVRVSDASFARAHAVLGSDQRMFELVAVTASYNMVARILVAMNLKP